MTLTYRHVLYIHALFVHDFDLTYSQSFTHNVLMTLIFKHSLCLYVSTC